MFNPDVLLHCQQVLSLYFSLILNDIYNIIDDVLVIFSIIFNIVIYLLK